MRTMLLIVLFALTLVSFGLYCESKKDPYEEGSHWSYSIQCENGFVYKTLDHHRGTIQVLNSDGTPLKCGEKIH